MIRLSNRFFVFFSSLLLGTFTLGAHAQSDSFKVIKVDSINPGAVSSTGVLSNGTLYVAGQGGLNADRSVPKDFQQEVAQSMQNVQKVLQAADLDYGNAVWMNIFVTSGASLAAMNNVYWKTIGADPPARSVVVVGGLPGGENIEINCIAVSKASSRRAIWPQGWPHGKRIDPPGIQAGEMLYMSAQEGADPATGKPAGDYAGEVKQSLDNVAAILKTANMSMANVVWTNPYMASTEANMGSQTAAGPIGHNGQAQTSEAAVMNKIYATYFEFGNTPARGTMPVVDLPDKAHIVFSAIAGADLSKRKSIRPINMELSATASPGILYGDTYYMSGKSGFIPDQGIVTPDVDLQLRQSMRNLLDDLEQTDLGFADVVSATIYLREMKDMDTVQNRSGTFFKGGRFPARTTMQNSFDMKTATAEQISFIAVRQPKH